MRGPLDHRGNIRTKLRTLWHYDLLCHSTVVYRHLKHPAALHCFLFGCLRDSVAASTSRWIQTGRRDIKTSDSHRSFDMEPCKQAGFLHQCKIMQASHHQCMVPCLLHGPPRKMQMEGLRPAVVAAGEDVAGRMHASSLTVMSICPLRCAFVNTLLCHLNCRFWLPPFCRKSHFRSLETLVIQLHHDAGKSSCLQGLCSVHLADEERDAVCSAARSLDPSGGPASKCRASVHKFRRWPELPATQVRK